VLVQFISAAAKSGTRVFFLLREIHLRSAQNQLVFDSRFVYNQYHNREEVLFCKRKWTSESIFGGCGDNTGLRIFYANDLEFRDCVCIVLY